MQWFDFSVLNRVSLFVCALSIVSCGHNLSVMDPFSIPRTGGGISNRPSNEPETPPQPGTPPLAMPFAVPVLPDPYPLPDPFNLLGTPLADAEIPGSNADHRAEAAAWWYPPRHFSNQVGSSIRSIDVFEKVSPRPEFGYVFNRLTQEIDGVHVPLFARTEISQNRVVYQTRVRISATDAADLLPVVKSGLASAFHLPESDIAWNAIAPDALGFRAFFESGVRASIAGGTITSPNPAARAEFAAWPFEIKIVGQTQDLDPWMVTALNPSDSAQPAHIRFWSNLWVRTRDWPQPNIPMVCNVQAFLTRVRELRSEFGIHEGVRRTVTDAEWNRGLSVYFLSSIQTLLNPSEFCRSDSSANQEAIEGPRRAEALHRLFTASWLRVSATEIRPRSDLEGSVPVDLSESIRFQMPYELEYIRYVYHPQS